MRHTMKTWERVEARLRREVSISAWQYGFMHRVEEHYRCDASPSLYGSEKADDTVPREELWFCMKKSRVAEKYDGGAGRA